jgi:hypothetical protein
MAAIRASGAEFIGRYSLVLRYNNARMDVSNCAGMLKILEDTLKGMGLIVDDSPKYCRSVSMVYDETLPKRSCSVDFVEVE